MRKVATAIIFLLVIGGPIALLVGTAWNVLQPEETRRLDNDEFHLTVTQLVVTDSAYEIEGEVVCDPYSTIVGYEHRVKQTEHSVESQLLVDAYQHKLGANESVSACRFSLPRPPKRKLRLTYNTIPDDPIETHRVVTLLKEYWLKRTDKSQSPTEWLETDDAGIVIRGARWEEYRINPSADCWDAQNAAAEDWLVEIPLGKRARWTPEGHSHYWMAGSFTSRMDARK